MSGLSFSNRAVRDLEEIWHYIARDSMAAADRVLDTLHATCDMLADFPQLGPSCEDIAKHMRYIPVENYLVFYRILKRDVKIMRVVHGARDFPHLFR